MTYFLKVYQNPDWNRAGCKTHVSFDCVCRAFEWYQNDGSLIGAIKAAGDVFDHPELLFPLNVLAVEIREVPTGEVVIRFTHDGSGRLTLEYAK